MKKTVFGVITVLLLASCGGGDSKKDNSTTNKNGDAATDITKNPDYQNGLALVAKYKCLTCHTIDDKLQGPPYREVANRYAGQPDTIISHLAGKIIKGGNGQWGEIYMTPHKDLSQEDAETMVRYILLLKK